MKTSTEISSVTVKFNKDELEALVTLMDKMSTDNIMKLGLSHEQAELIYLIYRELYNCIDDK